MEAKISFKPLDITHAKNNFDEEIATWKEDKSKTTIHIKDNILEFSINSKNITALRASFNTISKLIETYENITNGK